MELDNKITVLNMLDATKEQIMAIETREIVRYLLDKTLNRMYTDKDVNNIQMMFNIIKGNDINHGIKETNSDR